MPNLRPIASTQPEEVTISVARTPARVAISVLLTAFNVAVVSHFCGTLYRATVGRPFQAAGVTLLFAALFASLFHMWIVALRRR